MLNIVIPAAGNGKRFREAGYDKPKHLIDVLGKPMIERVIDCIRPSCEYKIQVLTQESLGRTTGGAVETILAAEIDSNPLLIANSDQLVSIDIDEMMETNLDGALAIFKSNKPHHSYVNLKDNYIVEIREKEVISNNAVTGLYYFRNGLDFKHAAEKVIEQGIKYNNEYYVSSAIAEMISEGYKLGIYDAPVAILGTPSELQLFLMAVEVGQTL